MARERGAPGGTARRRAVLLRLDARTHDALARWAADELRSTNAHIEYLLHEDLVEAGRLPTLRQVPRARRPEHRSAAG